MQWNLEQLSAFVAVCEHGSFSAAARVSRRVQSAVSGAIALLEADLGVVLFERSSGRQPRLTPAGEALLHEAREVLRQCERFERRARVLCAGEESRLRLAIDEAMPYLPVLGCLEALAGAFPLLELTLFNGAQGDVAAWVAEERADLGLLFLQERMPAGLDQQTLGEIPVVAVAGRDHPLAQLRWVDRRALAAHRQLLIAPRLAERRDSERIGPQVWRVDSFYAIAELVVRSLGWALVPLTVAHYPTYRDRLVVLRGELSAPSLAVELVWRRDRPLGAAAQWLARSFAEQLADAAVQR